MKDFIEALERMMKWARKATPEELDAIIEMLSNEG